MASYLRLDDKSRDLPWRAKVKGGKVRYFPTKTEAESWATEYERQLRLTGVPPSFEERSKLTVGSLIERYLKEITPSKGSSVSETTVLKRILGVSEGHKRNPICELTLSQVSTDDGYKYVTDRLKDTWRDKLIKPSTVKRETHILCRIFNVARRQWHKQLLQGFENPFTELDIDLPEHGRERRLDDGELERLIQHCEECRGLNKEYIPIAIYLAIETGMRLQEIFNLTWKDLDFQKRTIRITKSKTDYKSKYNGRTIVMTVRTMFGMADLSIHLLRNSKYSGEDLIFPITKGAFKQSWADVVKRAGITDLHFHDLRHEAASRFDDAGLTHAEHGLMMGHGKRTMRDRYSHATLKAIQDKLDRHILGGKTHEEALQVAGLKGLDKLPFHVVDRLFIRLAKALEAGQELDLVQAVKLELASNTGNVIKLRA